MKKALPLISLLCYVVAVAGCIAHIICEVMPSTAMLILFIAYVVGVLALMGVTTAFSTGAMHGTSSRKKNEVAFEGLSLNENQGSENAVASYSEDGTETVAAVFADEPEEEKTEEEPEEATEEVAEEVNEEATEEVIEESAEEAAEEVAEEAPEEVTEEVAEEVVEEVAEEATEEVAEDAPDEDEDDDDDDDNDDDDDDEDDETIVVEAVEGSDSDSPSIKFKESRLRYSYTSKLIQAEDETKDYYSAVKNAFLSYKKVTATVSREHERFRRGRATIGIIKLRGKTVVLYLALDPAQFENTMYVGKDVSGIVKYEDVPFQYRVKGPRKAARAIRLIAMVAEKFGLEPTAEPANEDYKALYPYETTEALIEKGLVIDKVAEASRKAEEARIAAEAAEKAAEHAINEAIKAQQTAEKAAFKAAEKAEEHAEELPVAENN